MKEGKREVTNYLLTSIELKSYPEGNFSQRRVLKDDFWIVLFIFIGEYWQG